MTAEDPNTVHGRLLEAVHISGYTFERACTELEWLLEENRWKQVGGGFGNINEFLATIDLSEFRIAIDQRKNLAKKLADIQASQRATARVLGVNAETVRRDLGAANAAPVSPGVPEEHGKQAPADAVAANAAPPPFDTTPGGGKRAAEDGRKRALHGTTHMKAKFTGENEWYTPPEYLDAARDALGGFDLDPATSAIAQKVVAAGAYFDREVNGLERDWFGRVWLNPPYAQPFISEFVSKMVAEVRAGRVEAGIMLTHNYTDTAWFHEAASVADAICFTRGRIKFIDTNGVVAAPTQGQAFFYFGDDLESFAHRFVSIGLVLMTGADVNA